MKKYWSYIFLFLLAVLFDRVTKWWALSTLPGNPIALFKGFSFSFAWNRGISWGLFGSLSGAHFYLLTAVIVAVILFFTLHTVIEYQSSHAIFFESLVLAGAASNLFDRIYYKAVIDFIDIYVGTWHWPTFNVADVCIVVGIFGIVGRGILCARER
jgi:signal peptidase II